MEQDKAFESYWRENKNSLLHQDIEYLSTINSYKMHTGTDLLLYGLPVIIGITFAEYLPITHELLKWVVIVVVTLAAFVVSVYIKSRMAGIKSVSEIERRVKAEAYEAYCHRCETNNERTE